MNLRAATKTELEYARLIIEAAAKVNGQPVDWLTDSYRFQPDCQVRYATMWLIRENTQLSLKQIATLLGRRDHTTVLNGLRRVTGNPSVYRPLIKAIEAKLRQGQSAA